MKRNLFPLFLVTFLFTNCNQSGSSEKTNTDTSKNVNNTSTTNDTTIATNTQLQGDDATVAAIDVNGVKIKLHKLIKFEPKGNQFLKADNSKFDYYIMDLSIENSTGAVVNSGTEFAFNIDIESKDGKRFLKIDPSAKVLSLYDMEVAKKDQSQYDKLWGKINAGEKVRSFLRGYEVPKTVVPAKLVYDNKANGVKKEAAISQ